MQMTTNTNNTWEDMTDEERVFALRRAKELMNGKKEDPFIAYLTGVLDAHILREIEKRRLVNQEPFWVRINKKPVHNVKKSHKTERKVSR